MQWITRRRARRHPSDPDELKAGSAHRAPTTSYLHIRNRRKRRSATRVRRSVSSSRPEPTVGERRQAAASTDQSVSARPFRAAPFQDKSASVPGPARVRPFLRPTTLNRGATSGSRSRSDPVVATHVGPAPNRGRPLRLPNPMPCAGYRVNVTVPDSGLSVSLDWSPASSHSLPRLAFRKPRTSSVSPLFPS
jgi:hypothetical protein